MEIIEIFLLTLIAIEGALILLHKEDAEEERINRRREIYGTFKNPLGDTYRKNTRGQLVPINPHGKMIDGDEEEDEV